MFKGCSGGLVVSMLTFSSDDLMNTRKETLTNTVLVSAFALYSRNMDQKNNSPLVQPKHHYQFPDRL